MISKKLNLIYLILILTLLTSHQVLAGGPLEVRNGKILSYETRPFFYKYDTGRLGTLSNEEAVALVEELFSIWSSQETANIKFVKFLKGFLETDINASNFKSVLKPTTDESLNGFTPIVFDEDGTLLDAYVGKGASNSILGVGGPIVLQFQEMFSIPESQIILNGMLINGIDTKEDKEVSINVFKRTIVHEIGHAIGLSHSQINTEALDSASSKEVKDSVPIMFPRGVSDLLTLRQDDISAISLVYPKKEKLIKFGQITGRIFRKDGRTPVLGANVILRNTVDPLNKAISGVSDFLEQKNGLFTLFAIPPGTYTLEIEPISTSFKGGKGSSGSAVGPYSKDINGESFIDPVPKGYFTDANLPIVEDKNKAKIIEIKEGDLLTTFDIISTLAEEGSSASLNINGSSTVALKTKGHKKIRIEVIANNFLETSVCRVYPSIDLSIKPIEFLLNSINNKKTFGVTIPKPLIRTLIKNKSTQEIILNVNCSNGAKNNFSFTLN